jgi:hypothetical protein
MALGVNGPLTLRMPNILSAEGGISFSFPVIKITLLQQQEILSSVYIGLCGWLVS